MIKNILIGAALGGIVALTVSACSSGSQTVGPIIHTGGGTSTNYLQIELLSRPAVKEAFESFADHTASNTSEPYNDPTIKSDILTFSENTAGRSATWAGALQATLYPNELQVDLSSTATSAGYLGVETGGKLGTTFGGRSLTDDTIDTSLAAIFGNALVGLNVPDDGKESPCLATDNLPAATPAYAETATFPYSQGPV